MKQVILVLDALGIGEMPDVPRDRPQDVGTNTLRSLVQAEGPLQVDTLLRLGLGQIARAAGIEMPTAGPLASYGKSRLAHVGADSYLGHQEIMGTIPKPPIKTLMTQAATPLQQMLTALGHTVRRPLDGKSLLLVDEALVIADNLEADPGLNINLTVATDLIDFGDALTIGRAVRGAVTVSRVIVFGGPKITVDDILDHVEQRDNGQLGVNSPSLGVYNHDLRVQHLGYGVDPDRQAASILSHWGLPVTLLGKMADLVVCPGASRDPAVPTPHLMHLLLQAYLDADEGLIAATVQETDLAAHGGDVARLAAVLQEADQGLEALLPVMAEGDVLIICADHGNDPRRNIGLHTREETPLLVYQKGHPARSLGVRDTLADIGATITCLFGAPPTQDGSPIIDRSLERPCGRPIGGIHAT
jgi:phosphopentomutase